MLIDVMLYFWEKQIFTRCFIIFNLMQGFLWECVGVFRPFLRQIYISIIARDFIGLRLNGTGTNPGKQVEDCRLCGR